ncbi:MOSC domain-containing protein [Gorillibacterium massiliense]|uniref:MOSC domain-containing protein n=1 Tax=Gorillibacterium massiliense TaxID=1280390 RepID=UPI0004B5B8A6|nr:MOSC domain-containing protein [Gorillibacterium massiliense]
MSGTKIVSLLVGKPAALSHREKTVESGINKKLAVGPLYLTTTGFAEDGQADLVHHGGPDKAVCAYCQIHYPYWEKELERPMPHGSFGENTTLAGLSEDTVSIGDVFRMGNALVQVSQPRQPCYKLAWKHDLVDLPLKMESTGWTGFYFRVLEEGMVGLDDAVELVRSHPLKMTIARANEIAYRCKEDAEAMRSLLAVEELSASWKTMLERRLSAI